MFRRKNHLPPEATYREVWKKGDAATKASVFLITQKPPVGQGNGLFSQ